MMAENIAQKFASEWAAIEARQPHRGPIKWPDRVQEEEEETVSDKRPAGKYYTSNEIAYLISNIPDFKTEEEAWALYDESLRNGMPEEYTDALFNRWAELDNERIRNKPKVYHCAIAGCHNTMSCASADLIRMSTAYESGWICPECLSEMYRQIGRGNE